MIQVKYDYKYNLFYVLLCLYLFMNGNEGIGITKYDKSDLLTLREEVRDMFNHAYNSYLKYAYPYDELRPLTCDGMDTWGSYSLTLIDALDTLAVMGNYSEFQRVVDIITTKANFDSNINVSVFETNIRIVGGLLSAHLLSQRAGVELEPGWPCNGPLLRLAEDVAKRLIAAFDTTTGMPYGTVNLRYGVPPGETSVTCTAGVGTFIVEFGTLSKLTGDPVYEEVALNALYALYNHQSPIGLVGNHIDVLTGRWTAQDSGIGAGVDSYFEYLVKGAILLNRPELMAMFNEGRVGINKYLKRGDWYLWVSMQKGQVTLPVFQSLEAYWPGVLSLIGDVSTGMKSIHNYYQVWKQYGFTPEFYNIPQAEVGLNRHSYPLRPELAESAMYLYRATGDPFLLDIGVHILRSIQHSSYTPCGYATIDDTRDHSQENRMESFFLAETTKYLYLLFDPDNFIHNKGQHGTVHTLPSGKQCILDAGGYIFNTEAHPIDPGALLCCSDGREDSVSTSTNSDKTMFQGEKLQKPQVKSTQEESSIDSDTLESDHHEEPERKIKIELQTEIDMELQRQQNFLDSLPRASTYRDEESVNVENPKFLSGYVKIMSQIIEDYLVLQPPKDKDVLLEKKMLLRKFVHLVKSKDSEESIEHYTHLRKLLSETIRLLGREFASHVSSMSSNMSHHSVNSEHDKKETSSAFVRYVQMKQSVNSLVTQITKFNNKFEEYTQKIEEETNEWDDQEHRILTNNQNIVKKEFAVIKEILNLSNKTLALITEFTPEVLNSGSSESDISENVYLSKLHKESWKSEEISYQVDDHERVAPVSRLDSSPLFTDRIETSTEMPSPLPEFVSKFLISSGSGGSDFDPQQLLERIRTGPGYRRNITWADSYELLSCSPQPFLTRISLSGEFFNGN